MVGTSNISSLMLTQVPADKQLHKALVCVRAPQSVLCCIGVRMAHLKAPLHSYWWRCINRFMGHGGPLYKPGNTHQEEVPPSPSFYFLFSHSFMSTRGQPPSVLTQVVGMMHVLLFWM